MVTTTLYKIIKSKLIQDGFNEFVNKEGELVLFDEEYQFTHKILSYDDDVSMIVDDLFHDLSLEKKEYDTHFKRSFIYRFVNRQINRQTIESFKMELMSTFMTNEDFISRVYEDMDLFITQTGSQEQENKQGIDGITTSDNRQAFSELPQSNVQLDVNDTVMTSANENTISRNKQTNIQETDGTTTGKNISYKLDELLKSNGILEHVFDTFDKKCFLQVW